MADAGADILVAHMGLTTSGSIGAHTAKTLAECVPLIDEIAAAAKKVRSDVLVLCHGGPIAEPEDAPIFWSDAGRGRVLRGQFDGTPAHRTRHPGADGAVYQNPSHLSVEGHSEPGGHDQHEECTGDRGKGYAECNPHRPESNELESHLQCAGRIFGDVLVGPFERATQFSRCDHLLLSSCKVTGSVKRLGDCGPALDLRGDFFQIGL